MHTVACAKGVAESPKTQIPHTIPAKYSHRLLAIDIVGTVFPTTPPATVSKVEVYGNEVVFTVLDYNRKPTFVVQVLHVQGFAIVWMVPVTAVLQLCCSLMSFFECIVHSCYYQLGYRRVQHCTVL